MNATRHARIIVDVHFEDDAVDIDVTEDGGLNTLELAAALDIAKTVAVGAEITSEAVA